MNEKSSIVYTASAISFAIDISTYIAGIAGFDNTITITGITDATCTASNVFAIDAFGASCAVSVINIINAANAASFFDSAHLHKTDKIGINNSQNVYDISKNNVNANICYF